MRAAKNDRWFENYDHLSEKEFRYNIYKFYMLLYKTESNTKKIEPLPLWGCSIFLYIEA